MEVAHFQKFSIVLVCAYRCFPTIEHDCTPYPIFDAGYDGGTKFSLRTEEECKILKDILIHSFKIT